MVYFQIFLIFIWFVCMLYIFSSVKYKRFLDELIDEAYRLDLNEIDIKYSKGVYRQKRLMDFIEKRMKKRRKKIRELMLTKNFFKNPFNPWFYKNFDKSLWEPKTKSDFILDLHWEEEENET